MERRQRAGEELLCLNILLETGEAVAPQGYFGGGQVRKFQFIKHTGGVADEEDATTFRGDSFNQGPVLLEHSDHLEPVVVAGDVNFLLHRLGTVLGKGY